MVMDSHQLSQSGVLLHECRSRLPEAATAGARVQVIQFISIMIIFHVPILELETPVISNGSGS
jgi:hypothetical protein